jgi:hypothetical protein
MAVSIDESKSIWMLEAVMAIPDKSASRSQNTKT